MKKGILVLPFLGAILSFYAFESGASIESGQEKAKVIVQELKLKDDTRRLLVPVKVEAKLATTVTAEIEGLVTKVRKPLGSKVKAGEVILYVENKDPAFTYAAVPVRSPVAGVVSQLFPSLMSKVSRGDKLFSVINPKTLKLSAEIPGTDLPLLEPGSEGAFKLNLSEEKGIPIRVVGVSPLVDPRTGTASAELEFAPSAESLPPIGSVGHALFEKSQGEVLLVPESALGYREGKPIVSVLNSIGEVVKKKVELGEQKESQVVVKSGLAVGERIVVRANRILKDGEAVEVEEKGNKK